MEPLDSKTSLNLATSVADLEEEKPTQRAKYIHQKSLSSSSCSWMQGKTSVFLYFPSKYLLHHPFEWWPVLKIATEATSSNPCSSPFPVSWTICFWLKASPLCHRLVQGLQVPAPLWLLLIRQPIPLVLMCSYQMVWKAQVFAFPILSGWCWNTVNGPHS